MASSKDLLTFKSHLFTADEDLILSTEAEREGDLYEVWEVRSDSPNARLRCQAMPEKHARRQAAEWTDESVRQFMSESRGPNKPKVMRKYVAVKVEVTRTVA